MSKFEAVVLFNPDLSNQVLQTEDGNFISMIEKLGGTIFSYEEWGLRSLSYNIEKYKKAFYKYYQIELDGKNITSIKKNLTQNEKILRHLFVKVENHQQLPTKMVNNEEK